MKNFKQLNLLVLFVAFTCLLNTSFAQDDLLDLLNQKQEPVTNYTFATFKSTHLISGHSIETNGTGVLQFLVGHRFGRLNSGARQLFGLDNATIRLGFEYGLTDDINIGIGRSSFEKTFDIMAKWRFLKQKNGASTFPFTATWVSSAYRNTTEFSDPDRDYPASSRMNYHHTLLMARKFNQNLSLQLMPTIIHRNLVVAKVDNNTIYSLGVGGSIRLNGSLRANVEYYYIPDGQITSTIGGESVKNSLSIGIDLETGGHVFQLHLTNSRGMTEKFLVGGTTGNWGDGDIHFGFNVSRVFTIKKPEEFKT